MEIDWSKAPEATHYDKRPGCAPAFMRKNHNGRDWEYMGMNGHWIMYGPIPDNQLADLIKRPIAWTGEGLPPVGLEVEARFPQSILTGWTKFTLMYLSDQTLVYKTLNEVSCEPAALEHQGVQFRPIRTPDQIAAEERRIGVNEMVAVFDSNFQGSRRDGLEAMWDAGYRKQPTDQ